MPTNIQRVLGTSFAASADTPLAPTFVLLLLAASCALASFAVACATPFAAFAALAAATLPLSSALLVVAAAWIVNQAIGFGALHYPHDIDTIAWGVAIGAAALIATAAAALVLRGLAGTYRLLAITAALAGAYAAYEIALLAWTPFLGGEGAFTPAIVAHLAVLNILWMIALAGTCGIARVALAIRHRHAWS